MAPTLPVGFAGDSLERNLGVQEEMWPHVSCSYSLLRNLAGSSTKGTQRKEEEHYLVLFLEMA